MTGRDLEGARVVVLRVGDGPDDAAAELARRGAIATTVRVATVEDRPDDEVVADVGDLDRFAWVAVTSANAARRLVLWRARWPEATRIAAVGPATETAVRATGLRCDLVATEGTAASLAHDLDGGPVLFVAGSNARDDLTRGLGARGIEVTTVTAYDVASAAIPPEALSLLVVCDAVVALSPGALERLETLDGPVRDTLRDTGVVCIGPSTATRAAALSWPVRAIASGRTARSVGDAVRTALGR